jgi:SNF family Na+-dependent transporter
VAEVSTGGPGLAFVTIPEALSQIPFAAPLFALLFFATVFFLAIDSAMAMVESVVNPLKRVFRNISLSHLTLVVCVIL